MNPENLDTGALSLFNTLDSQARQEAIRLTESLSENEAVYLAAMRRMPEKERRQLLFSLSRQKWGV